jgi:PGM1 C-terminal domain
MESDQTAGVPQARSCGSQRRHVVRRQRMSVDARCMPIVDIDAPATADEIARFRELQAHFARSFSALFNDPALPRTVLIVPSSSLDQQVLAKISGVHHYEERMLCLLLLLRMPRTRIVYVTSTPISDTVIDYYLHLLPGVPEVHARRRLTLISCDDASSAALTRKVLDRPRVLSRIREAIPDLASAHMTCFTVSELERKLALTLGVPIYGCDPSLLYWGSKSGSRKIIREAGIDLPFGFEDLIDGDQVVEALAELKGRKPELRKAVVKLNEGFSGEGNAILDLADAPTGTSLVPWLRDRLSGMAFEARGMTWELYRDELRAMGAISTHDQVLGGANGQIYLGCRFPADEAYRLDIQARGAKVAQVLAGKGVLGRFGIDFISVKDGDAWRHLAIEVNLRKGGTTHPFLMLQFLTDGRYDADTGKFLTPTSQPCCYYASDNLESKRYRGLTPYDLVDIAVVNGLHFHAATGEGVVFHLIGALSEFGKLGVVCIAQTHERADSLYRKTVHVLDRESTFASSDDA